MQASEPGFQRSEEGVVVQPMSLLAAKLLVRGLQVCTPPGAKAGPGCFEQPMLERNDDLIVNGSGREGLPHTIFPAQESILDEEVRTDQEGVAGEGRERLIRRVAVPPGAQRERLPPRLSRRPHASGRRRARIGRVRGLDGPCGTRSSA